MIASLRRIRQQTNDVECLGRMSESLHVLGSLERLAGGNRPMFYCFARLPGLRIMISQHVGVVVNSTRCTALQNDCKLRVQTASFGFQQAFISGIAYQRMLERIDRM